jgi:hypothetical protein
MFKSPCPGTEALERDLAAAFKPEAGDVGRAATALAESLGLKV